MIENVFKLCLDYLSSLCSWVQDNQCTLALVLVSLWVVLTLACRFIIFPNNEKWLRKPALLHQVPPSYQAPISFQRLDQAPGWYEAVKTGFMMIVLPIRVIGAMGMLISFYISAKLTLLGAGDLSEPIASWRRVLLQKQIKFAVRGVMFWFGFIQVQLNDKRGKNGQHPASVVIVGNHISYLDILLSTALFQSSFVAKESTKDIPIIGFLARAMQTCFVPRSTRAKSKKASSSSSSPSTTTTATISATVKKPVSTTSKIIARQKSPQDWGTLLLFPEGLTTNGDSMVPFRRGAFVAGMPVRVICIRYHCKHFHLAYDSIFGAYHLFRTLTQFVNHVEVTVLPDYVPTEEEQTDPQLYANNVNRLISNELNIEILPYSFRDKLGYLKYLRGDQETRVTSVVPKEEKSNDTLPAAPAPTVEEPQAQEPDVQMMSPPRRRKTSSSSSPLQRRRSPRLRNTPTINYSKEGTDYTMYR